MPFRGVYGKDQFHTTFHTSIFLNLSTLIFCLMQIYSKVDQPSCSTPKKRPINPSSIASIEELRTPSFEELLRSFWESKSSKHANGDAKHILEAAVAMRDSRVPLTALN